MDSNYASSFVAKMIFFTKGKGLHKDYLTSFELALRDAAISDLNLVSVASIMPPECKIVTREEGRKHLLRGQIAQFKQTNRLVIIAILSLMSADIVEIHLG